MGGYIKGCERRGRARHIRKENWIWIRLIPRFSAQKVHTGIRQERCCLKSASRRGGGGGGGGSRGLILLIVMPGRTARLAGWCASCLEWDQFGGGFQAPSATLAGRGVGGSSMRGDSCATLDRPERHAGEDEWLRSGLTVTGDVPRAWDVCAELSPSGLELNTLVIRELHRSGLWRGEVKVRRGQGG